MSGGSNNPCIDFTTQTAGPLSNPYNVSVLNHKLVFSTSNGAGIETTSYIDYY